MQTRSCSFRNEAAFWTNALPDAEIAVAIHVLNCMLAFGGPIAGGTCSVELQFVAYVAESAVMPKRYCERSSTIRGQSDSACSNGMLRAA